jgi:FAD synthetase
MKKVLAAGVFDLLHYGHYRFLEEAKKAGGRNAELYVIVARDSTVKKTKGRIPIMPEDQRRALVEGLKPVKVALLGSDPPDYAKVIEKISPDIIAVGYDQGEIEKIVKEVIETKKLNTKVVKIPKFELAVDSSSKIKKKIIDLWR